MASPSSNTERGEAYDAVSTDELGAEWLTRATESQSARPNASPREELEDLTTLDLRDEEPLSLSTLDLEPDSEAVLESEAALNHPDPQDVRPHLERPRPPPRVFDIADLTQDEDTPRASGRRS